MKIAKDLKEWKEVINFNLETDDFIDSIVEDFGVEVKGHYYRDTIKFLFEDDIYFSKKELLLFDSVATDSMPDSVIDFIDGRDYNFVIDRDSDDVIYLVIW